ncbi:type IV toxin-antitoxin system AbiEi family antitoxin [Erwinia sp. QL-Z3]|uniref:type IV toxin-antitoxin system AbiEi family antitoxin n=1 Tax=Erwinia sp. QL-Z3 TaxID=2547962 RepID=UPI001070D358|nr:type IV toxin-antitoxin system AbiEi family antitoxin [Erwinia sp. QL-Z3]QBR49210.1 hypothetical protein E2F51_03990 [Erwinia sp. QL-Z3]
MIEEQFLSEVVESLPKGFELKCSVNPQGDQNQSEMTAKLLRPDGKGIDFTLEIKKIHRVESLMSIRNKIAHNPAGLPLLLICNQLTPTLAEYCFNNCLNYIDTAGNAIIQTPELYVLIKGKVGIKPVSVKSRFAEGVMKLLFVLLSRPESLNETYRSLAAHSSISLGMVSKAFEFLEAQKYYRKTQHGRRLMNVEELQVLWRRDYAAALLPKLSSIPLLQPNSWHDISLLSGECWGGEVAAAELTGGYLIAERGTLFTPLPLTQRRQTLGLKPHREGKLQLVSSFWGDNFELNKKAIAMLCVAELLASVDDRNLETAKIINDKYLQLSESALFSY